MRYTSEQIDQINNAIPIVKYAQQYLDLKQGTGKRRSEYWAKCPFHQGDINPSMSINIDKNLYKCMGCNAKGGLINFVMQYHHYTFPKAIDHILSLSNMKLTEKKISNTMEYLYKLNLKKEKNDVKNTKRKYLPENIMDKYTKKPILEWMKEGLTQEVIDEFQVRYDEKNNSIVFPIRDTKGIIAIKSRTLIKNHLDLGIPKYQYYNPIGTNDFLFGLYDNLQYIKEKNEVIVVESEKGVMILRSFGIKNVVAICAKQLNKYQINLLLSLKCNIIFAYDADVAKNEVIKLIKPLSLFTNVEYMYDNKKILKEKESPYDQGVNVWNKLYNERIKVA